MFQSRQNKSAGPVAFQAERGNNGEPLIRLRGIRKMYHSAAGDFEALKGIDLDVYPGEFVAILGKSGAGKTTLINMLTGVDRVTAGEVWVASVPVHRLNESELALWRGKNLGIIYQSFHLMPTLSLLDNVILPMDFTGQYRGRRSAELAAQLLRQVQLDEHALKLPSDISGGQQQRVAIARALANDPPLIVADEPTGRLDSATAEIIFEIFRTLVERGKTILMVTHDNSLAERVSRSLCLVDGEIVAEELSASNQEIQGESHALLDDQTRRRIGDLSFRQAQGRRAKVNGVSKKYK